MKSRFKLLLSSRILSAALAFIFLFSVAYTVFATPSSSPYAVGETLDPSCAPGSTNCYVAPLTMGDTIGSATAGSVFFGGTAGVLAQDNSNLFWDDTNNRLGIGTSSPSQILHIVAADGADAKMFMDAYGTGVNANFVGRRARGTSASPAAVQTSDILARFSGRGYGATTFTGFPRAAMDLIATQTWTDANQGTAIVFKTTANSTTTTSEVARIDQTGYLGIGDTSPAAMLTVGSGDLFQVNSSGAIAAATGITSSGTITFSGFSTNGGLLYTNGSGVLAQSGAVTGIVLGNGTSAPTATTTSASLPSIFTDETGSGGLVFATSPTLVTPTLGAASATSIALSGAITGATGYNGLVITANTGDVTTGTWSATAIGATKGGTGQTSYTVGDILYASTTTALSKLNASTSGYVLTSNGASTAPSWQALPSSGITSLNGLTGSTQTFVNDTNVTITSSSTTHTLGWSGQLALTRGGTAASLTASNGGIIYSTASAMAVMSGTSTAGLALISGASTTPTWFAPTIGSVLFAGTGGILQQDNSSFYWDDTNNRLGIGTTSPAARLDAKSVAQATATGTVSTTIGGNTLTGSGTLFSTELTVGDRIVTAGSQFRTVIAIASATSLTVDKYWTATESGVALTYATKEISGQNSSGTVNFAVNDYTTMVKGTGSALGNSVFSAVNKDGVSVLRILNTDYSSAYTNPGLELGHDNVGGSGVMEMEKLTYGDCCWNNGAGITFVHKVSGTDTHKFRISGQIISGAYASQRADLMLSHSGDITTMDPYIRMNVGTSGVQSIQHFFMTSFATSETVPTALVDVGASTTSNASMRIRSGTAPSSPNEGDVWYDGTDLIFRDGSASKKVIFNSGTQTLSGSKTFSSTVFMSGLSTEGAGDYAVCRNNTTKELTVDSSGTCTVSSARFKHDIIDLDSGLSTVLGLRPVSFRYNTTNQLRLGLVAEEVLAVEPRLVFYEEDGTTPRGVNYEDLTAVLVKAVQELNLKVAALPIVNDGGSIASQIVSYLADTTEKFINGIVHIERLIVGSPEKRTGITIYDTATGDPFCISVENGVSKTTAGECPVITPAPSAPPAPPGEITPPPSEPENPPAPPEEIVPPPEEPQTPPETPPSEGTPPPPAPPENI